MNREMILSIISVTLFLTITALFLKDRYQMKKTFQRMNDMLEEAVKGEFKEQYYDESQLSKLEMKLKRILADTSRSREEIRKEKEMIQGFISDISHQTKLPITNILLYTQLLSEDKTMKEDSSKLIELIISQTGKLEFLIRSLIKLSRMEAGMITLHPKPGILNYAVDTAMEEIQVKARGKHITIQNQIAKEYQAVFDEKWTAEAIFNVLDNAVKYTEEGGTIHISLCPYEMFLRLDISDNGIGIKEEELNRIFLRFYRSSQVSACEGVGIGLSLTRKILKEEGGYIKVSSVYGEGSAFSIFIPKSLNLSKLIDFRKNLERRT